MSSITCTGSIALDTTRTPFKVVERVLGGSASYFSLSSSFFAKTYVSSIVGDDFPQDYWKMLSDKSNVDCVERKQGGKTFHYDSTFSFDMYHRETNKTETNVLDLYQPKFTKEAAESEFLFLASLSPQKQLEAIKASKGKRLVFMDTIEHYIKTEPAGVEKVISIVDGLVLNDSEARMITKESSLIKAGLKLRAKGPKIVVIKKGEHGCLLFFGHNTIPFPAFPLEEIVDPTGAGDSFAGGLVGYLCSQNAYSPSLAQLKKAIVYATVMGSIAVKEFSVNSLHKATRSEIDSLYEDYCKLLSF